MSSAEERSRWLLDRARRLQPRQILILAGLWAGATGGTLDPDRQYRRNAARLALRYVCRAEEPAAARARSASAAIAIGDALAALGPEAARGLRGPAADAICAVADALDALAHADRLSSIAYEELIRPWVELTSAPEGIEAR